MQGLKVSIGIPTYNRSEYLIRAVESAIAQSYPNIEIIVSDNCSTDDTAKRVSDIHDPRVKFLQQTQNLGMTGNFNACLHAATGDLFLMLSDDDLLYRDAVERLSEPLRRDPADSNQIGLVWCPANILNATGEPTYATAPGPSIEPGIDLVIGLFRGTRGPRFCSIIARTKDVLSFGGYDIDHGPICDVGNWTRIALSYPSVLCVPEPLVGYTVHASSTTSVPDGRKWQRSGEQITRDAARLLDMRGDAAGAKRIRAAGADNTSNLIATVMMQYMGKPGWVRYWISEVFRAPRYLFAPVVFKRLARDGWKLVRLRSGN